jgi:hypothetical protein
MNMQTRQVKEMEKRRLAMVDEQMIPSVHPLMCSYPASEYTSVCCVAERLVVAEGVNSEDVIDTTLPLKSSKRPDK